MNILIASAGRTSSQLARVLISQKHNVSVVESRPEVLSLVHKELPTEIIYEGDFLDIPTLERAGIKDADVLVAGTDDDHLNLLLCYLAEERYQVPRKIARVNNPKHAWLFDSSFHVDYALNQVALLSMMIEEEISTGHMMVLLKLGKGNFSLVKEVVPANAPIIGKSLKDLGLRSVIAAIIRNDEVIPPHGDTVFMENDEVIALVDRESETHLAELFNSLSFIDSAKKDS
ncbi:potassium channel family protein [Flexilinea flocculi]|jgi:trk system potassium uptake protein TrkA|uniref:Trk system potassium uptake protein TrkA n=1 Tax=Flexilinea flocculi TaxID=1678840 RepID=A0A0S7BZI7_9CHLR|nr:TrkA family potassium uptake protein [Flexilinea flocculi]NMB94445.1 TrkA family potassium uptake protein [Flexilinea flocculi]GAP41859.1 Trk K+ transport system, NAD-binding component [Flexilinea flocculi]